MPKQAPAFAVGDRIAYSVKFLKSTGQTTGSAPQMRATITEVFASCGPSAGSIIHFQKDDGSESGGLSCNFTLLSRIGADSALNT